GVPSSGVRSPAPASGGQRERPEGEGNFGGRLQRVARRPVSVQVGRQQVVPGQDSIAGVLRRSRHRRLRLLLLLHQVAPPLAFLGQLRPGQAAPRQVPRRPTSARLRIRIDTGTYRCPGEYNCTWAGTRVYRSRYM
ncbi:unnamed protein product, partial [Musa acuminata var. zebrina]